MDEVFDRIDRSIDIDAEIARVWQLVSTPGWFINDGAIVDHRIEEREGYVLVHDPVHGALPLRTERLDAPNYAAFRWLSGRADDDTAMNGGSTLVEFWLAERPGGGVTLRVVESGFASLSVPDRERRSRFDENTSGWADELRILRDHLVSSASAPAP